jgi:hypothetical protein
MILKTLEQFKAVIPTAASLDEFSDIEVYIKSAEMWIKSQLLGKDLYNQVNDSVESSSGETTDEDLLNLCRSVIANHAYWDAIPFLDLTHTNQGFGVVSANNLVPASKERVERLREQCLIRRDTEAELLIEYLEEHTEYHDLWKGSPAYTILSECLIRTAAELKQYSQWTGTRKDFLQLQPKLLQETMMRIEPVFSKDYVGDLIELQRDDDLTLDDKKVLVLLKSVLGCLATGNIEAAEKIASDALRYMDANPESFESYFKSDEHAARIAAGYVNTAESTIFSSLF